MLNAFKDDRWEILRSLPVFVALFLEEYVPDEIAKWTGWNGTKTILGLEIGCAVVFVLGVACIDALLRMRMMDSDRRKYGLQEFEGIWTQSVAITERPYALARIEYDRRQGRWNYSGVGFDRDFQPAAEWHTYSLVFRKEESDRPWFFAGQAHLRSYDKLQKRFVQTGGAGNVLPRLCLPTDPREAIEGTVADIEIGGRRNVFQMTLRRPPPGTQPIASVEAMLRLKPTEVRAIFQQLDASLDSTDVVDAGADTALPH